jgi:tight adherence protein C
MASTTYILLSVFVSFFSFALGLSYWISRDQALKQRLSSLGLNPAPADVARQSASAWGDMASRMGPLFTRMVSPQESGLVSELRLRFYNAGLHKASWLPAFLLAKVFLALLLPALAMGVGGMMGAQSLSLPLIGALLLLCAVGYYIPNGILSHLVQSRQHDIQDAMPDALDLLIICLEAGLGMDPAMRKAGAELGLRSKALSDEFEMVVLELQVGASRDMAMKNFASRTGVEEAAVFVATVLQSEHFGSNMADSLRVLSETMRDKRMQRAEETAAKIPIKLLFPTLFFIFPSIFIVLLGPIAISIARTLLPTMAGVR